MTHARDAHQASEHTNKKNPADTSDEQDKHNHIVIVKLSHQTRITQISEISTQVTAQFCDFKSIEK